MKSMTILNLVKFDDRHFVVKCAESKFINIRKLMETVKIMENDENHDKSRNVMKITRWCLKAWLVPPYSFLSSKLFK